MLFLGQQQGQAECPPGPEQFPHPPGMLAPSSEVNFTLNYQFLCTLLCSSWLQLGLRSWGAICCNLDVQNQLSWRLFHQEKHLLKKFPGASWGVTQHEGGGWGWMEPLVTLIFTFHFMILTNNIINYYHHQPPRLSPVLASMCSESKFALQGGWKTCTWGGRE